jgi:hypothetical protein
MLAVFQCGDADSANSALLLSGKAGAVYGIEAANELSQWSEVARLTNRFGTLQFNDSTLGSQRFYRAVAKTPETDH